MKRIWPWSGIALTVLLLLGTMFSLMGCSGYGTQKTTSSSSPASPNAVTLANFAFSPATLTVKAGTTVTWTNNDSTTHTVTSDTGVFNSGNLAPNATFSYTFSTAGTYAYHCSIHSTMKGTIIVQ